MLMTTCNSPEILKTEIESVRKKIALDETEETWDTVAQGICHLTRLCNVGACQFPSEMVAGIRSLSRPLNNALNSERSRLSGAAVELVMALATGLELSFEPLASHFFPTLLALCGRTNKVFTSRARACILAIIQNTRLPSLLPYLAELSNHKSVFPRLTAAEGILACLNCFNPPDLEKESRARIVEDFIKLTARDANADVRKASKEIFKAYKTLLPTRVESFVAPLTPVVKKYLDIQSGPSGSYGASSNAGQKQTSRPPSRAATKVAEAGERHIVPIVSKPPVRPVMDDLVHSQKQQPAIHAPPPAVDVRGARQRTMSQTQRDPPTRSLQLSTQSSSTAQRCVIPNSASTRQAVPHSAQVRVLPARNAPSAGGPQRPPSVQMKLNPPPDRLKVTGNGAKRVPLPPGPTVGQSSEQAPAPVQSADRTTITSVDPPTKPPSRSAEVMPAGKLLASRRAPEGSRSVSLSTKSTSRSTPLVSAVIQRSSKLSAKGKSSNPPDRLVSNVQKGTRPLVKAKRKETSPALIPLPPSPSASPTEIPLPPSPDCMPHPADAETRDEAVVTSPSRSAELTGKKSAERCQEQGNIEFPATPITALLSSIQRGFLFTPSSPLSPPQNYLPTLESLPEKRHGTVTVGNFTKGSLIGAPFCLPLEDDCGVVEGSDRHALRDRN